MCSLQQHIHNLEPNITEFRRRDVGGKMLTEIFAVQKNSVKPLLSESKCGGLGSNFRNKKLSINRYKKKFTAAVMK